LLQGENEPREEVGEEILVIDRERGHRFRDVWAKVGYREVPYKEPVTKR
jgi:hypothetical protein